MISIIITSFNEPQTIGKAIESFLNQNIKEKYELIVSAPDKPTLAVAREYKRKYKQIKIFSDPGKGKSHALNLLLPKLKGDIILLTDGDVYVSENSVNQILEKFKDKKVGCVSGRPVPQNPRKNLLGFWSHSLCHAAHNLRQKRSRKNQFLECSGYLWAFRNKVIKRFPKDVAEDTIIPIMFWLKGWKIDYSPESEVYVNFPKNLREFIKQKIRTAASHETLHQYVNPRKIPKMKSFLNEVAGTFNVLLLPRTIRELSYTFLLFPVRFYIWANLFYNAKIRKRKYTDAWKRIESTK